MHKNLEDKFEKELLELCTKYNIGHSIFVGHYEGGHTLAQIGLKDHSKCAFISSIYEDTFTVLSIMEKENFKRNN